MAPVKPDTKTDDVGDTISNVDVVDKQDTHVEGTITSAELTMINVFSKRAAVMAWAGLFLVALLNYMDLGMIHTFQIYAVSEFNRLSIEGALLTAIGVATIGKSSKTASRGPARSAASFVFTDPSFAQSVNPL
jgi:hypothetical protein